MNESTSYIYNTGICQLISINFFRFYQNKCWKTTTSSFPVSKRNFSMSFQLFFYQMLLETWTNWIIYVNTSSKTLASHFQRKCVIDIFVSEFILTWSDFSSWIATLGACWLLDVIGWSTTSATQRMCLIMTFSKTWCTFRLIWWKKKHKRKEKN